MLGSELWVYVGAMLSYLISVFLQYLYFSLHLITVGQFEEANLKTAVF